MGGLSDIINGKEKTVHADKLAKQVNQLGKQGLTTIQSGANKLTNIYNQDPTELVENQINMENKFARGAADDAMMRTRDLIAQRGIGSSSIGLGQEVNQRKSLMDKLAMNKASGIQRLRDTQIENAEGIVNTGNALFAPKQAQGPMQMQSQKYRSGGYGSLIGSAMGAGGQIGSAYIKANGKNGGGE